MREMYIGLPKKVENVHQINLRQINKYCKIWHTNKDGANKII